MISFGNPAALLWLLALVPVVLAAAYASRRRRGADEAFGGPPALRRGRGPWCRPCQLMLLLAALTLATLAAARPQWGTEERELARLGIDIAIALDISRSMMATDLEPSRAEAAAAGLQGMLNHLRGDRVGLVIFSGDAFERSPLTLDLAALGQLLARSQNETALVQQGTDLSNAIDVSLRLLAVEDPASTQVIVLISDGEDLGDELGPILEQARALGIRIYTVAAGTTAGGAIPTRDGGEGKISQANYATLTGIAEATGGDRRQLGGIMGLAVEFQRLRQSTFDEDTYGTPIERFQWFLGTALLFLSLQMLIADGSLRHGIPRGRIVLSSGTLLAATFAVACGSAEYNHVRDGNDAYTDGRYSDALATYREARKLASDAPKIDYNVGNALHQLARYEEAAVASAAAAGATEDPGLFARSTYAVGSHAFRRDDLKTARKAYISVLLRNHDDRDSKHNLELTLRRLANDNPESAGAPNDGDNVPSPNAENQPSDAGDGTPGPGKALDVDTPPGNEQQPQPGEPTVGSENNQAGPTAGNSLTTPTTVEDAQALLSEALLLLGDDALTLENAISILDLVRVTNELESLEPRRGSAGGLPNR